ncbi:type I restriction enzyme HsdR N-terminal domain-containing protein [Leptothoe spongobia]|uniref:Type I restriction enzyme HsdR N-terminal domain-containing protein n=1 Tax=Leptothoe spongobia TAU-MAC 1115 TaxID=1967444 RepID=A0A947DES3_9CYAN|nr:type I restriction enzyme HsdR N-terminal domain-containing protein [Leptothoe spongobia]MBT9315059.1 type I restriction enzyme HsdR N-terminal domain-containing protein [Leptothoe spongobia TAU-MAC 1115]
MNTAHPDIVIVSPDGEYLIIVEVKLNDNLSHRQSAIEQLKSLMASMGCSVGLAVTGDHILLLRDSLEKSHGESITMVSEALLPEHLLPSANEQWKGHYDLEFEARIQQWLETLKQAPSLENLPSDLRQLFSEPTISLLRLGEIRAAGPRWSKVAS